eukprot:CAMPEP_0195021314 /NCGR_PEP_ID=MMETSP0326_2-20130528/37577_1 /TAXON_ID=2866 ORGANISM="Crypthecodinium cohnii, Strain Seligo" /NCGR_SAMPLE_ID=MMETSP0326_2 /ASSEMBLY_ACC=CAM_ASM_000348 /LENGTH=190 /DNA_ID=CAMNT_0040040459 /DNA_START=75 /DNA_END=647 /DNA_ORIENTATION=-
MSPISTLALRFAGLCCCQPWVHLFQNSPKFHDVQSQDPHLPSEGEDSALGEGHAVLEGAALEEFQVRRGIGDRKENDIFETQGIGGSLQLGEDVGPSDDLVHELALHSGHQELAVGSDVWREVLDSVLGCVRRHHDVAMAKEPQCRVLICVEVGHKSDDVFAAGGEYGTDKLPLQLGTTKPTVVERLQGD